MAENAAPTPVAAAGNRRALIFLAIGVALVLLVVAAKMFTGSSHNASAPAPNPLAVTAVAPSANQPVAHAPAQPAPAAVPVDSTRNPFQALR